MKATEAKFLDFIKKSPQFIIPIYQRTYSWIERECRQLWDDILRTGGNDAISAHFVGSIVYIEKGLYQVSSQSPLLVIDGQQRLTTVTLFLEALARHLGDTEPLDGFSAKKLRSYYLLNPLEDGERGFKLLLTQTDKASLLALVQQKTRPVDLKTGEIPNVRAVYEAFKAHARAPEMADAGVDALVAEIDAFAGYYCSMTLGKEPAKSLAAAFQDLRELKVDVAYPFLLELHHDYAKGLLSAADFEQAVRLIEAYVFRRAVCAIPTNSFNKTFATFGRALRKDRYLESIKAHLLSLPSYRRFPADEEFKRELAMRDLYNFRRRSYWLRRLENYGRKDRVPVDEYTIEHILPQNENLSAKWHEALGPDWQRIQETWLHTLGNLTLTGYNAEYSDRPFVEKRDIKGGFRESPLKLNKGLGMLDTWDETAIQTRAERLAVLAAGVWFAPSLAAEVLDTYRPKAEKVAGYTIEDHPQLAEGTPMRLLFDVFRKEVLAVDACVSEEFLKLYVAYKAETNFVDVVPQKSRLRLSLNMQFHELHDPKGFAKDVTNLGRWGNGDVEVALSKSDELPYAMGLVRHSFEKQMGNGEAET